jgi:hypothetical protein
VIVFCAAVGMRFTAALSTNTNNTADSNRNGLGYVCRARLFGAMLVWGKPAWCETYHTCSLVLVCAALKLDFRRAYSTT